MDSLSLTASIIAVAGAGYQISLALISLAKTVGGAAKNVKRIGDDIYITCGILHVKNPCDVRGCSNSSKDPDPNFDGTKDKYQGTISLHV